jgi:hypothetical protein
MCPQPTYDKAKSLQKTLLYCRYKINVLHWHQLYEQQKQKKATSEEMTFVLDCYVKRWQRWVAAWLLGIAINPPITISGRVNLSKMTSIACTPEHLNVI